MDTRQNDSEPFTTAIEPWLTVTGGNHAVDFYRNAFNAAEIYRMEDPGGGLVVKFSIEGASFWISNDADMAMNTEPLTTTTGIARLLLVVSNPDAIFDQALRAGAATVFPVEEQHGWRVGRVVDPFGHHWEICRPIS